MALPGTRYVITHCEVRDSAELSRNNMSAFWANKNWRLSWTHRTLEEHIDKMKDRIPRNLLQDRAVKRHLKAIDATTGRIVGYVRWVLPESCIVGENETPAWPDGITPAVSDEEEGKLRRLAESVIFDPKTEMDVLETPILAAQKEILARKPYILLEYLAVHPDHQGKGIATALVQSGLKQAQALGLDVFVLACASAVSLYKRCGFRVEQDFLQDYRPYGGDDGHYTALMILEQSSDCVS